MTLLLTLNPFSYSSQYFCFYFLSIQLWNWENFLYREYKGIQKNRTSTQKNLSTNMRYLFKHVESMHLIDTAIIHNEIHFDKLKKVKTTLIPPFF